MSRAHQAERDADIAVCVVLSGDCTDVPLALRQVDLDQIWLILARCNQSLRCTGDVGLSVGASIITRLLEFHGGRTRPHVARVDDDQKHLVSFTVNPIAIDGIGNILGRNTLLDQDVVRWCVNVHCCSPLCWGLDKHWSVYPSPKFKPQ